MKRGTYITALILGLLGGAAVLADGDADRARLLVELQRILPLEEILKRNKADIVGRIIEVELEEKDGIFYYEIKVLSPSGRYKKLRIDAETGALLGRK